MTIHRIHKKKQNFSMIQNEGVQCPTMTWAAKGILWLMISKPDGWEVKTAHIASNFQGGTHMVRAALTDLEKHGYLIRWCDRNDKGQLLWRSEVFETIADAQEWKAENEAAIANAGRYSLGTAESLGIEPKCDFPHSVAANESQQPKCDFPHSDKPHSDKPHSDKPHSDNLISENRTSYINTERSNNSGPRTEGIRTEGVNTNPEEPGSFASLTHAHTYTREEGPTPTIEIDRNPDPQQHPDPIAIAKPAWTPLPSSWEEYQAGFKAHQEAQRNANRIQEKQENPISATERGLEGIGSIFQRPAESNSLKEAARTLRMHGQVDQPSHLAVNPVSSIVGPTNNSMTETIVPPPPAASATKMPLEAIAPPDVPMTEAMSLPEAVSGRILDEQIEMPIASTSIAVETEDWGQFLEVWNTEGLKVWVKTKSLPDRRIRAFKQLVKDFGGFEEAIAGFRDAIQEAKLTQWCLAAKLDPENLMSNGKIIRMAEAWRDRGRCDSSALVPEGGAIDAELVDDASAIAVAGSTSGSVAYQKTGNDPEGFAEFWGIWTAGVTALGRTAIGRDSARDAWIQMHGYACPEGLIDGARSYLRQELKRYQKDGKSFTYGAKRFIAEQVWVAALERDLIAQTLPAAMTEGREYELKKAAFWAESDRIYREKYANKEAHRASA